MCNIIKQKEVLRKDIEARKKAAFALHEQGKDDEALELLRGVPRDREVSALLFRMRCDDQAKGIVSRIDPQTEERFAALYRRLVEKKQAGQPEKKEGE